MFARTRILDAADRLFTDQGIRAVGVDAIVAAAETAKTTLYAHFASKDGLVVAYLQRRAERQRERLEQGLVTHGGGPVERILHLYDLLAVELAEPGYRGSPFTNACVELGSEHPAATVAHEHRRWLLATFTALAAEAATPDPDALAAQLLLLHDAAAQAGGDAARTATTAAEGLLAAALVTRGRGPADRHATARPPDLPIAASRPAGEEAQAHQPTAALRTPKWHFAPRRRGAKSSKGCEVGVAGGGSEAHPLASAAPAAAADGGSREAHVPRPARPAAYAAPAARIAAGGSAAARRIVAFLNSAHLPDGDDQLADDRAGPWIAGWLADASRPAPAALVGQPPIAAAPADLLVVREGLRELAAVNCGAQADPHRVAQAVELLGRTPLLVDLEPGDEPQLTPATGDSHTEAEVARSVIAVVVGDYLAVRARGEWPRVKVCSSPDCRWAFVDGTRNRSRRWCDMAGCGNRAKNRAWRHRQTSVTS